MQGVSANVESWNWTSGSESNMTTVPDQPFMPHNASTSSMTVVPENLMPFLAAPKMKERSWLHTVDMMGNI